MGLARAAIKLIAETVRCHKISGRALIIGKQDVWGTEEDIIRWLRESGLTPASFEPELSRKPDFRRLDFIQDTSLFRLMGFGEAITLDYSDYEGAEIICNLSHPLPDGLLAKTGRFDLIVDAGCLEHIFNVPQVLENYYHLAGDKGVVILIVPSSNLVDHGFYSFSPTLFQDYYSANHWQILRHYFFESYANCNALWKIYDYKPGGLVAFAFSGGLGGAAWGVYLAAQKQAGSTCDAEVQQGMFLAAWTKRSAGGNPGLTAVAQDGWPAVREKLKPYIPRRLIPILMTIEAKIKSAGGVSRYLERHKWL